MLNHLHQVPLFSRRLRVLADGMLSTFSAVTSRKWSRYDRAAK